MNLLLQKSRLVIKGLAIIGLLVLVGCEASPNMPIDSSQTQGKEKKLQIVTSFYPLYEIAKQVGGDTVVVNNLVPPGAEPHDYEPTPRDIANMHQANLIIYNGAGLEPWVTKLKPDLEAKNIKLLDASLLFNNLVHSSEAEHHHEGEEHTDEEEEHIDEDHQSGQEESGESYDPHFWLDPLRYAEVTFAVEKELAALNSSQAKTFEANQASYNQQITELHQEFQQKLSACQQKSFVTTHAAFNYLAQRYGLEMIPITGVSPEAEPSLKTLTELSQLLKQKGVRYIFVETLVSPKVAEALAKEVGAQTLTLNPLEGLTQSEIDNGKSYITVMKDNLKNLQIALECK